MAQTDSAPFRASPIPRSRVRRSSGVGRLTLCAGLVLVAVGIVWILQGLDLLKGSFMSGRSFWAWMGALAVLSGLPLAARGLRRR